MVKVFTYRILISFLLSLVSLIGLANVNTCDVSPDLNLINSDSFNNLSVQNQLPHQKHKQDDILAVEIEIEEDISSLKKGREILTSSVITFCLSKVHSIDVKVSNTDFSNPPNFYPTSFRCLLFEVFRI